MEENKIIKMSPLSHPTPQNTPVQPAVYTVVTPSGPVKAVATLCFRGGVRPDKTRPTAAKRLLDFETEDVFEEYHEDCDTAIKLQSEYDAMVYKLDEKDNVINQQAEQIKTLKEAASESEFDIFEVEYWRKVCHEQLQKFNAIYSHCCNLADDIDKKDDYISALVNSEEMAQNLYQQQKTMAISLLALTNKERKSKFIMGDHKLSYAKTAPTEALRDEMERSAIRKRGEMETAFIKKMVATVDSLTKHYSPDRYQENISTINLSSTRSPTDPEGLPDCVPSEMFALWLYQEELTPEEELQYDRYLQQQLRPLPTHSPPLLKPFVNWAKLNPFQHRNLPAPSLFPIQGCSQVTSFYTATMRDPEVYLGGQVLIWGRKHHPFGALHGFNTNMGAVAVPSQPLHGYRCCPGSGTLEIDARG